MAAPTVGEAVRLLTHVYSLIKLGMVATGGALFVYEIYRNCLYRISGVISIPKPIELRANPLAAVDWGYNPSFDSHGGPGIDIIAAALAITLGTVFLIVSLSSVSLGILATYYVAGILVNVTSILYTTGAFGVLVSVSTYFRLRQALADVEEGW